MNDILSNLEKALSILQNAPATDSKATLALYLKKRAPILPSEAISIAIDSHLLRPKAIHKLGEWAKDGYFSSSLLPQASRISLAKYRAHFFSDCQHVLEIGTGTGSDTAALARTAKKITTIEQDSIRAALARHNIQLQGLSNVEFMEGSVEDIIENLPLSQFDGFFADPARRTREGARIKDASLYSPSLHSLLNLTIKGVCAIKVSPGLFLDTLPSGWCRQFLGYEEQCLEQTLWKNVEIKDSSVMLVDSGEHWSPSECETSGMIYPKQLHKYLYEAHGAINRSLYLNQFFSERSIYRLDNDVAYGTSDIRTPNSSLLTRYTVVDSLPYSKKTLQRALASLHWTARTEFKKRAFSEDIEKVRQAMNLPKHHHAGLFGTVFLFRWRGLNWVALGIRDDD